MEKFYNITKGQLITIWIFGTFTWLYALEAESVFGFLIIPGFLIFYSIGWRSSNTKGRSEQNHGDFDYEFVKSFLSSFKKDGRTSTVEGEALYELINLQFEQGKYAEARKLIVEITKALSKEAADSRS